MAKSPAFRFYPSDFMGSPDVQSMELSEVGAYTFLLCVAWQQDRHGTLPDDDSRLRRWARMSVDQWRESRDLILSKFPVIEDGLRGNKRMMDESDKQKRFSESQKKKVENRWKNRGNTESIPGYGVEDTRVLPSVSVSVSVEKTKAIAQAPLPEWLDKDAWGDWVEMRKRMRKPLSTQRSINGALKDLKDLVDKGHNQSWLITEAVKRNWLGFYLPSNGFNFQQPEQIKPRTIAEKMAAQNG